MWGSWLETWVHPPSAWEAAGPRKRNTWSQPGPGVGMRQACRAATEHGQGVDVVVLSRSHYYPNIRTPAKVMKVAVSVSGDRNRYKQ